jgi:peptidyl-prolyl cis-trans isomerase C
MRPRSSTTSSRPIPPARNTAPVTSWSRRKKAGAKFEDLAKKHSKDPGSGQNGGDLDFAKPDSYVPEFGKAMAALKKGETTAEPVKSQFGYHIIRLEDTREASFPAFDDVKGQIKQRLEQARMQQFQEELRAKAKTDYKFTTP